MDLLRSALISALVSMIASSFGSNAPSFDLKMDLSLAGKHVSSPHVVVKEGEPARVTHERGSERRFIEVIAAESPNSGKGILVKFSVGTLGKNGERTITATPQVLVKEGLPATITQNDSKSGKEHFSFSVTARKTSL